MKPVLATSCISEHRCMKFFRPDDNGGLLPGLRRGRVAEFAAEAQYFAALRGNKSCMKYFKQVCYHLKEKEDSLYCGSNPSTKFPSLSQCSLSFQERHTSHRRSWYFSERCRIIGRRSSRAGRGRIGTQHDRAACRLPSCSVFGDLES